MEISEATVQQERLQAIAEKRKRQAEVENKKRQLEDDRRNLQHLKSKALRERWLLEGAPSSTSQEDEAMKHQMQEDELKTKELEESIQRLEKELEMLVNGDSAASTKENLAEAAVKEEKREDMMAVANGVQKVQTTPLATAEGRKTSKSPVKMIEGSEMLRAAMYSVEITVEKDKVTGETKVLSSTTLLPQDLSLQGVKVYEDELKVVHEVRGDDGIHHSDVHLLSSTEVDDLIHKADEVSDVEKGDDVGKGDMKDSKDNTPSSRKATPRKEITGVQAKPAESPKILNNQEGAEPSKEQPVTMIFMGYQNVEDENETKKVLGLEGTIKAELVVIEDADKAVSADNMGKEHAPPNGSTVEPAVLPQKEDNQVGGEKPEANDRDAKGGEQDLDMKKHRCKCCTVM
ncbi:paralemmin-1 isoform X1 [Microcaecilia unicolor]|uniref:Paralemmin-1 n=1 Tax=Microcaecilia unicolor TaxID=1415580 RepID=A0A6P7ZDW5_9AMPH|nr:paralemmin-1 isoform X1 [Microcaecilia unicolor]